MKALAGMLLAVALAIGIGDEASAQSCKHFTKTTVKHHRIAKSSSKKKSTACLCSVAKKKKKKHHTGMIKTSTYAGYIPSVNTVTEIRESIEFPVNPLPGPSGEWDNTGRDLRRYPPQSHVLGEGVNPNPNQNTNSNMNWLQNTDQQQQQQQPPQLQE